MLSVITIDECEKWDSIVRTFVNYDVYYLSGYVKAFKLHGDGEPLLFYYDDGEIKGINVVMNRDISTDKHFIGKIAPDTYFDFATPYGYGGWLIEGNEDTSKLFDSYLSWCKENGIISEFVRFHPVLKNHVYSENNYDVIPLGETIAMDLTSPDVIWQNIISKNRNMIRKAIKNGVSIYSGRSPELFEVFKEIYNATMDKDNAEEYYYFDSDFYKSILDDLPNNAQIFYAQLEDGTIIAASIMIAANGRINYHLSGSRRDYQHLAPTNLLLYRTALWGCENGFKTLYLGGGVGSGEDSLFKFKRAFYKGKLNRFYIGKATYDETKYKELLAIRVAEDADVEQSNYFPKYRG